ncbi:hypothetical protein [Cupriavidus sp. D39]|nr:hypothetical protein [Cupriavidus sp. D39]MCY0856917.1 hypothetical protein [Cupriavidus sp. D39]
MTRSSRPVATSVASPEPALTILFPALPSLTVPPSVRQRGRD